MQDAMAAADLVVSRAGAATLAELTALGIPSILVPYPHASENHQEYNARALEKAGAAALLPDRDLNGPSLLKKVNQMMMDQEKRAAMAAASKKLGRPDALQDIVEAVAVLLASR